MEDQLAEILDRLLRVLAALEDWLQDAPRQDGTSTRLLLTALPISAALIGAFSAAWLTYVAQLRLLARAERTRAFDEVLSPIREALQRAYRYINHSPHLRFSAIEEDWRLVQRLIDRDPRRIYLPPVTLDAVRRWFDAENYLESLWDTNSRTGAEVDRVAFAILTRDSSLNLARLNDGDVNEAVDRAFTAAPDTLRVRVREALRSDPTILDRQRSAAEEWHATRSKCGALLREAMAHVDEVLERGA